MASRIQITKTVCSHCYKSNETLSSCAGCHLVQYCDKACQTAHWSKHKLDCKSKLSKDQWVPQFELENRLPAWVEVNPNPAQGEAPFTGFNAPGHPRAMPAIDVLRLDENEGADWSQPLNLLFPVSGDVSSVVKTVVDLPETFSAPLRIVINDLSSLGIRNYMLILMAISSKDPTITAELAVNLWYNEFWPSTYAGALRRMIKSVVNRLGDFSNLADISAEGMTDLHVAGPSFEQRKVDERRFGGHTLKIYLSQKQCLALGPCYEGYDMKKDIADLKSQRAKPWEAQGARRDDWDTILMRIPPSWREPFYKYFNERIVLPFGAFRHKTWYTNNTLRLVGTSFTNPLESWDLNEVLATEAGVSRNDIYGKLFFYVRGLFEKFIVRLRSLKVDFEVHNCDPVELSEHLSGIEFDRIMVSYLGHFQVWGLQTMLDTFRPLLKSTMQNRHATLIDKHSSFNRDLFDFNHCNICNPGYPLTLRKLRTSSEVLSESEGVELFMQPGSSSRPNPWDFMGHFRTSWTWKRLMAHRIIESFDGDWELYQKIHRFDEIAAETGMRKKVNTVVEFKPLALKLAKQNEGKTRATPESQAEFNALLAFNPLSDCRYVEWQRNPAGVATGLTGTTAGRHGPTCYKE
ncbi:hypothetical protein PFICI_06736 [Pestalotiopsis fici W106-1]|uniref:MYND-type domain-containing protein n=1 Tax=Pestalotiopsis fici (strain W106-1 / CGMCC3.15140) TaxID=1229662 RepID=W3X6U4_PESFW|nr:uncharacterized protein PFICI_06736 [Pestalotiopsis fici W106-1]ETS81734.1 hypothetical protein PFICI_06736 [Pestalotiopsis fici W106-1]